MNYSFNVSLTVGFNDDIGEKGNLHLAEIKYKFRLHVENIYHIFEA